MVVIAKISILLTTLLLIFKILDDMISLNLWFGALTSSYSARCHIAHRKIGKILSLTGERKVNVQDLI